MREPVAAAFAEEGHWLPAVDAFEPAHVLDDPEDRDLDPLEHADAAQSVADRDFLWGRDDDRAGERSGLDQRQLRVAGARRHVDDEIIELTPGDVPEKLPDDLHRSE